MTNKELIISFLSNVRTDLITDLRSKKISDGDLDMKTAASDISGELSGASYYYFLVHGRRPGKQPPIDNILAWIKKKGIEAKDISERSLAFLIARKIGKLGTDIYLGKRPALALEQIIKVNQGKFEGDLKEKYRKEITEAVSNQLKQIFV
jgi:hypothetical protein